MALYTKFSVQRALLLKVEDLEVLEGLQSHLGSYVKAHSSSSLYRPISTEGFKSLNRLEGWSAFAQISSSKPPPSFHLPLETFAFCRHVWCPKSSAPANPPEPLLRVKVWQWCWEDGEHEPGVYRCHFPANTYQQLGFPSKGGQPLDQVPLCPYLSIDMFLISPSGMTDIQVLPWKVDQTSPCLRSTFHPLFHMPGISLHIPYEASLGTG